MSIGWNVALNDLIPLLAGLYPDRDKARFAVRKAALDPDEIDLTGTPKIFWMRIVEEVNRHDTAQNLIDVAKEDFPNINFAALEQQLRQPTSPAVTRLGDDAWKGPATVVGGLEKIIGGQPTFLPISFLELGLWRARSVVRVESPLGLGTGISDDEQSPDHQSPCHFESGGRPKDQALV